MVKVKKPGKTDKDNKKGKWAEHQNADSFGVTNNGDLMLVKLVEAPPGHQGGMVGKNIYTYARGKWAEAEVVESKLAKPAIGGIVTGPGPRIGGRPK